MYGVVVCPDCRTAKAYEKGTTQTSCPRCGDPLDVTTLRTAFETDDEAKLREAVGRINARLAGDPGALDDVLEGGGLAAGQEGLDAFGKGQGAPQAGSSTPSTRERVEEAARSLARASDDGVFSRRSFEEALRERDVDPTKADHYLSALVEEGVLYEPRSGDFRLLE